MSRPRVKPEHVPYRIADGKIRIGGVAYGLAAEISDPDGWVWTMLSAMDGSREPREIVEYVHAAYPDQPVGVLREGAEELQASGYVEDVAGPVPPGITERDRQRFERAVGYYRWLDLTPRASSWEPQARLRDARVTILGVGGTGGIAALALAASGVGHLHCVDPDEVELSNLSRQILYAEDDIGRPKAEAAVARLRRLNSDIEITGQRMEARGIEDVLGLAADCDVLLLGADRPPALRTWTNRACLAAKRPWVDSGYHGPLVQSGAFVPGEGPCWECTRLSLRDAHAADGVNPDDAAESVAAVWGAVGATAAGVSGYLAAHLVVALITGIPQVVPGRIETVNLAALQAPLANGDGPHRDCEACGTALGSDDG
jgi:molybdopterin/thiamine biosynthesis adenylyltransferase